MLFAFPVYRWENWGTGRLSDPKGYLRVQIQTQEDWLQSLYSSLFLPSFFNLETIKPTEILPVWYNGTSHTYSGSLIVTSLPSLLSYPLYKFLLEHLRVTCRRPNSSFLNIKMYIVVIYLHVKIYSPDAMACKNKYLLCHSTAGQESGSSLAKSSSTSKLHLVWNQGVGWGCLHGRHRCIHAHGCGREASAALHMGLFLRLFMTCWLASHKMSDEREGDRDGEKQEREGGKEGSELPIWKPEAFITISQEWHITSATCYWSHRPALVQGGRRPHRAVRTGKQRSLGTSDAGNKESLHNSIINVLRTCIINAMLPSNIHPISKDLQMSFLIKI